LLEALDDRRLLGGAISLLPVQRELLEWAETTVRNVWCLGRRSGKSSLGALVLLWMATLRPDLREFVRDDEPIYSVVVASNREQATVVLNAAKRAARQSPVLAPLIVRETDGQIDFLNGNTLAAFVCSSRTTRGWPISALMLDEMGFMQTTDDGPQAGASVYRALTPSQAQFGVHRRLILSSTPNGDGAFRAMFDDAAAAQAAGRPGVACFQVPSWEVRPDIPIEIFEAERGPLGEMWDAEFGAAFLGSGSALLSESDIRACVVPGGDLDRREGVGWVCGLDIGFRQDRSAAVILSRDRDDPELLRVGAVRTWEPAADKALGVERHAEQVLAEVAALANQYGATVYADVYEAATTKARLSGHGVRCETVATGAGVKGAMYRELAARVRLGQIEIPDHPLLLGEMRRLRVDYRGSAPSVTNPRGDGGHGDVASALGMAVYCITNARAAAVAIPTVAPAGGFYDSPLDDPNWSRGLGGW
jgi:hypothetical protein